MSARRALVVSALVVLVAVMAWALFVALPRRYHRSFPAPAAAAPAPSSASPSSAATSVGRRIKARLFYVNDDGTRLKGVEREVPYGESPVEQATDIMDAQIAPAAAPMVSAIPAGTKLRSVFLTDRGEAYVDLSRDVVSAHPGGSLNELLTVYTIVDALTANLPAITSVQILVDGREVDTLAGHVDLRRPLAKNTDWIQ
ncbi:MAG: GerMN domain-containing protein [Betaproteobacteria bacterium]